MKLGFGWMLNEKEGEREMLLNILYNYYIEYII